MANLLSRLFGRAKKGSGATAKDRLRFVLQHDRINLPPDRMEEMKSEILAVIVKYLVVDEERVEIDLEQRDRTHSKLVAEIPVAINTPAAAQKAIESPVVAADGADANGSNNGADSGAAEDVADDETEDEDKPATEAKAKANNGDTSKNEADKKP